jgi:hypothetical protein
VEWPIAMMLEGFKEKKGFSRENSWQHKNTMNILVFSAPMDLIYSISSRQNVIGSWCEQGAF